jgi:cyclic pyranopterin phosphate synthase
MWERTEVSGDFHLKECVGYVIIAAQVKEMKLSHIDEQGRARMVDVGHKADTQREAIAKGRVLMQPETLTLIQEGGLPKGDVLAVAQVAGVMAAKRTHELIPMCHPLLLTHVGVEFESQGPDEEHDLAAIDITVTVRTTGKTGVEMEALTGVTLAGLTIYDMCKAVDRGMRLDAVRLVRKSGGKIGEWVGA